MKKIFYTLALIAINLTAFAQSEVNWIHFEELEAKMEKEPRKVLVDVYTKWCGPCKMMMKSTFQDEKVVNYINENYYAVKFNAEGPNPITFKGKQYSNPDYDPSRRGRNGTHELTYAIAPVNGRVAYPTIVYLDENFKIISPVQGFMQPKQIEPILKFVGTGAYETTEWAEYQESFKGEF